MLSGNTPCVNDLLQISDKGLAIYDTTFFYYFHIYTPLKSHDGLLLHELTVAIMSCSRTGSRNIPGTAFVLGDRVIMD